MKANERNQKLVNIKKDAIIEGMERALLSKSYDTLTIDDVAKEAEYTKKTIYSYFSSKDEIYMELIIRKFILFNEIMEKAVSSSQKKGIEKIKILGKAYFELAMENQDYVQAILTFDADRLFENAAYKHNLEHYNKVLDQSFLLLIDTLKEAIDEGEISAETDVVSIAILLWSNLNGLILLILKKKEYLKSNYDKTKEHLFDYNMEMMLRLLKMQG